MLGLWWWIKVMPAALRLRNQHHKAVPLEDLASVVSTAAFDEGRCVSLRVDRPSSEVFRVTGRSIEVRKKRKLQLTYKRRGACDLVENVGPEDSEAAVARALASASRATATVASDGQEVRHSWRSGKGTVRTTRRPRAGAPSLEHDRAKNRVLGSPQFLVDLGVTDARGAARPGRERKLAQIRRFAEVLSHATDLDNATIVDMGCGRGYLTFAAHDLLKARGARVVGVDRRKDLVDEANAVAGRLGLDDTLSFEQADLASFDRPFDVLLALHACDTATDDALFKAASRGARVVLAAPCCHKQLRPQLEAHLKQLRRQEEVDDAAAAALLDIARHGVFADRHAEAVTDAMRALLLEIAGFNKPKIIDWIPLEHTAKNTMLIATRGGRPPSKKTKDDLRRRLRALASHHGVSAQRLATLMGESLGGMIHPRPRRLPPV